MSLPDASEIDRTMPTSAWRFDEDVAEVFDNMLHRSIPQYGEMRNCCVQLARNYRKPETAVVDLGCSIGGSLRDLIDDTFDCRYVAVDNSAPMIDKIREFFRNHPNAHRLTIEQMDIRNSYPSCETSVTLLILTLQFVPIEDRVKILRQVYDHTIPGGVVLLVEKVLGSSSGLDSTMIKNYHDFKHSRGYSWEAIEAKQKSLENVLVPQTAEWNIEQLRFTGFSEIDCFWRWMNFAGWIAVK
ncbi:MAG: methyltransferase domain-containing protein [Nostoc sp.]|uniref:methyltransferase domain-containing protein n=1 Tax=Nostoc sp. TaxID=1180 RepID=UPI002FF88CFB